MNQTLRGKIYESCYSEVVTRSGRRVKPKEREGFFLTGSGILPTIKPGSGTPSGMNITYMVPAEYTPFLLQVVRVSGGQGEIACKVRILLFIGT